MTQRILLLLIAIGSVLVLAADSAAAQDDVVTMTAEVGYDGYYRLSDWVPVRVSVSNSGSDLEGTIVMELTENSPGDATRYELPVILPAQSRKTIALYAGIDQYRSRITLKLVSGDQTITQTAVPVKQVSDSAILFAVVSGEPVDLDFLQNAVPTDGATYLAYIALDQLPPIGAAWNALDVLILNNVDTGTLSTEQLNSLRTWLEAGGHLVVTGGPNWLKNSVGLIDLLPVEILGSASVYDLGSLSALGRTEIDGGPFVIAEAERRSGRTLIEQGDLPLLVRWDCGLGEVDWLALDLALAPLRDWAGSPQLWQTILADLTDGTPWDNENINLWAAQEGLGAIPSLALPSALQMIAFLLIYTLVVGPINYLVVRRINRRELAWLTIPATVLVFSILAYVTGFQIKGSEVIFSRLSLVYGEVESDTARARGLIGVFSPSRATYDIRIPEGVLVRPLVSDLYSGSLGSEGSVTIVQGETTLLHDVRLDVARIRAFRTESTIPAPAIGAELTIDGSSPPGLTGWLTNRSDSKLESTGLWIGNDVWQLGDLSPGQTVSINERLSGGKATQLGSGIGTGAVPYSSMAPPYPGDQIDKLVGGSNYWNDDALHRRYQILQAFLFNQGMSTVQPQKVVFFAWSEDSLWNMEAAQHQSSTLDTVGYFLEIALADSGVDDRVVIAPALTTWQSLDDSTRTDTGPYGRFLQSDWLSYQYRPWEAFQSIEVDELVLHLSPGVQSGPVQVALWDWLEETWVVDKSIGWGDTPVRDLESHLGPNNAVRLRVENTTSTGYTIDMDVSFIGTVG